MENGEAGEPGAGALESVVEDRNKDPGCATLLLRSMEEIGAAGTQQSPGPVTTISVSLDQSATFLYP